MGRFTNEPVNKNPGVIEPDPNAEGMFILNLDEFSTFTSSGVGMKLKMLHLLF